MEKPHSTDKHINNLIEFRQAVYQNGFTRLRDVQFELVDALLLSWPIRSFPELSLNPVFRRQWSSAYAAVEDGNQDVDWLRRFLCSQVPTQGVQVFALDTTAWPRPSAPTPSAALRAGSARPPVCPQPEPQDWRKSHSSRLCLLGVGLDSPRAK